jgi:hypothetical protein
MLRVLEVIPMRGQSPQQIPSSQPFDRAQGGEQLIQPSGAKQSQLKSDIEIRSMKPETGRVMRDAVAEDPWCEIGNILHLTSRIVHPE